MKKILIFGSSSEIGLLLSKNLLEKNFFVVLTSSSNNKLINLKKKFPCKNFRFEKVDFLEDEIKISKLAMKYGRFDHIFLIPSLTIRNQLIATSQSINKLIKINLSFYIKFLNLLNRIGKLSNTHIHFISSVAAIRSRGKNTIYASFKIALEFYLKGLQHKNIKKKLKLSIIRLGFIDNYRQKTNKIKFITPVKPISIANYLFKNLERQVFAYYPFYWFFISFFLKIVPNRIYEKMQFLNK